MPALHAQCSGWLWGYSWENHTETQWLRCTGQAVTTPAVTVKSTIGKERGTLELLGTYRRLSTRKELILAREWDKSLTGDATGSRYPTEKTRTLKVRFNPSYHHSSGMTKIIKDNGRLKNISKLCKRENHITLRVLSRRTAMSQSQLTFKEPIKWEKCKSTDMDVKPHRSQTKTLH